MFFSVNPFCGLSELCWKQVKKTDKAINRRVLIRDETKFSVSFTRKSMLLNREKN